MIDLANYFVKNKLFYGPPSKMDYISYSGLCEIRRVLCGQPAFLIDPKYYIFGGEVHLRFLKNKKSNHKFTKEEEYNLAGMQEALWADPFVRKIMRNSIKEVETIRIVQGVNVKVILDINGDGPFYDTGVDIKTTGAKKFKEFETAAIKKWRYLGQSWLYKEAEQLDEFYFVGIQKTKPFNVYILNVADYAKEERATIKETEFLLDFYKKFGRAVTTSSQDRKRTERRTGKAAWSI